MLQSTSTLARKRAYYNRATLSKVPSFKTLFLVAMTAFSVVGATQSTNSSSPVVTGIGYNCTCVSFSTLKANTPKSAGMVTVDPTGMYAHLNNGTCLHTMKKDLDNINDFAEYYYGFDTACTEEDIVEAYAKKNESDVGQAPGCNDLCSGSNGQCLAPCHCQHIKGACIKGAPLCFDTFRCK